MRPVDQSLQGEIFAPTLHGNLALIREQLVGFMKLLDYSPHDLFAAGISLEEALTNAATHGNGDDPSKRVRVGYRIAEDEVCFEIQDEGRGFSASDVPDPRLPENVERLHGRGLLIMRLYMSSVAYNRRGNCVTMRKQRHAAAVSGSA